VAPVSGDSDTFAVRAALALLRGYKVAISPYFRGSCRFLPTCADYAAIAIARHGVTYGMWLAARRLVRCHPMCAAGHDPVPLHRFLPPWRKALALQYRSPEGLRHNN
jgi:putative membrane protein insertion efficiency factor